MNPSPSIPFVLLKNPSQPLIFLGEREIANLAGLKEVGGKQCEG
ncbi:hypothetical protein Tco_0463784, partial [Tanacetum coccineum]